MKCQERLHVLCTLLGITDEQLKEVLQHRTLEALMHIYEL